MRFLLIKSSSSYQKKRKENILGNLRSYIKTENRLLPICKVDDHLLSAVFSHISNLKISAKNQLSGGDDVDQSVIKQLDETRNELQDVRYAISKLRNIERDLNQYIKELVCIDVEDILEESCTIIQENHSRIRKANEKKKKIKKHNEKGKLRRKGPVKEKEEDEEEEEDQPPPLIPLSRIKDELGELDEVVSDLKKALNLVPDEEADVAQPPPPPPPADLTDDFFETFSKSFDHSMLTDTSEFKVLYNGLDINSRLCLLCFSVFPDNSVIKKRAIINWWIGEGYINATDSSGEKLLETLVAKRFIEPIHRNRCPLIEGYKVHPLTRLVLARVAMKIGLFDIDSKGNFISTAVVSRKACLAGTGEGKSSHNELRYCHGLRNLETLFNVEESYLDLQSQWFSKLKKLRVLQLGRWQSSTKHHIEVGSTDFLKALDSMNFLRYLSLRGISRISALPMSFSKLTDMTVLDLRACHNLQKLPDGIGKLKNLTRLDISECYLLGYMPRELVNLQKLQVLKGFVINNENPLEEVCKLSDLSMIDLKKVSLYISGKADDTKNELFDNLFQFRNLESLTITWLGVPSIEIRKPRGNLSRSLTTLAKRHSSRKPRLFQTVSRPIQATCNSPPESLKKIDLRCFPWAEMDHRLNPMDFPELEKLYIRGGELCEMNNVAQCCGARILRLKYMYKLSLSWGKLHELFPRLTYLEKVSCPKLSLYPCDGRGIWMKKPWLD